MTALPLKIKAQGIEWRLKFVFNKYFLSSNVIYMNFPCTLYFEYIFNRKGMSNNRHFCNVLTESKNSGK